MEVADQDASCPVPLVTEHNGRHDPQEATDKEWLCARRCDRQRAVDPGRDLTQRHSAVVPQDRLNSPDRLILWERESTRAGGGRVEGYPQDTPGRKVNPSFLYNGTRHLYQEAGFVHDRAKGKNHCVMTMTVEAAS